MENQSFFDKNSDGIITISDVWLSLLDFLVYIGIAVWECIHVIHHVCQAEITFDLRLAQADFTLDLCLTY